MVRGLPGNGLWWTGFSGAAALCLRIQSCYAADAGRHEIRRNYKMLSKKVLDALREQFHEEFGELSERDGYIQRVKADAFALIGSMAPNDRRLEVEVDDAITGIVSASSLLGFYIGLKTGADVERYISDSRLPEQILKVYQELKE